ncbi:MAG: serine hydrolase [Bacteroidota bacterium]
MRTLINLLLVFLFLGKGIAFAQIGNDRELEKYIEKARNDWEIPGLAVALIKNGEVIYSKGFGVKEMGGREKVDENTLFSVASNTKAFTALSVGLLVQQGKLSWDDPVVKHMPEFKMYNPVLTQEITIRDFLSHQSGLGLWAGDLTWWESNYDREEVIRRLRYQKPVAGLHQKYLYSNMGYLVVGELVARVSGMTYDEFIKENFLIPLEMTRSSTTVRTLNDIGNYAIPHSSVNGELSAIKQLNVDNCAPAAAMVTSINDLSHWVQMQLSKGMYNGKRIVEENIIEETWKPQIAIGVNKWVKENLNPYTNFSNYGLGWRVFDFRGNFLVEHTGGLDGMLSYVGFIPEENLGVVLVTNSDQHDLQNCLPKYLFDRLLEEEEQYDWSGNYLKINKANKERRAKEKQKAEENYGKTEPILPLEAYCGEYISDIYGTATIYMVNGQIQIKLSAHPKITGKITFLEDSRFRARWDHRLWNESDMFFYMDWRNNITEFRMAVRPDWIDTIEYKWVKTE